METITQDSINKNLESLARKYLGPGPCGSETKRSLQEVLEELKKSKGAIAILVSDPACEARGCSAVALIQEVDKLPDFFQAGDIHSRRNYATDYLLEYLSLVSRVPSERLSRYLLKKEDWKVIADAVGIPVACYFSSQDHHSENSLPRLGIGYPQEELPK